MWGIKNKHVSEMTPAERKRHNERYREQQEQAKRDKANRQKRK